MKIGIIGLGYVGLPLSLAFSKAKDTCVIGFDIDKAKIDSLKKGISYIKHIKNEDIIEENIRRTEWTYDFELISGCDAVVVCVPTPLNKNKEPDISYVLNTAQSIGTYLSKGTLVVLESTTYPGTTEVEFRNVLEKESGLIAGADFYLAFSPEREDPGNVNSKLSSMTKVVGGLTKNCERKACQLYEGIVNKVAPVSSCRAAEATKLTENIFRCVNIALVNELKVIYDKMGIDIWEVIEAAKTKPFGFMPFYPGPGLGGHCIPIDPFYLTWKAKEFDLHTRFIELAGEINTMMPSYVVNKLSESLNKTKKTVNGSRILVVGLAYKKDIDDIRESPAFTIMDKLSALSAEVEYYDPFVKEIPMTREHSSWAGKKSIDFSDASLRSMDAAIIVTNHSIIDYEKLCQTLPLIIDTRNSFSKSVENQKAIIVKA